MNELVGSPAGENWREEEERRPVGGKKVCVGGFLEVGWSEKVLPTDKVIVKQKSGGRDGQMRKGIFGR